MILARTFSKTFSPGLKTGYGVLPEALVEPVLRLKGNHDFGSANFNQVVLERLIADGSYAAQVETPGRPLPAQARRDARRRSTSTSAPFEGVSLDAARRAAFTSG